MNPRARTHKERFDGVFANACLFHVPSAVLPATLAELRDSLRPGGIFLASNVHGFGKDREGWVPGRFKVCSAVECLSLQRTASQSYLAKEFHRIGVSELQTHPILHSPVLEGSKRGRPQRGGTNLGVFCSYMAGHEDAGRGSDRPYRNKHAQICTPSLYPLAGDDRALTLLKRACANSGGYGAR